MICSSRLRNCRGIELSSRDFKTVAISVTRAKLYCINTWFACMSPSPEAQSPAGDLASAYPPKPLLFTLLGVGACDMLEQIEKLSRYRQSPAGDYRAGTSKLSQYRSLVCSSRSRNCRGIELSSRDFKTVAILVTRAKLYRINTWFACTSPNPEAQSPAGNLASAYPPKPLLFTLLGVGACDMLEQIKKLSRYLTIEQGLQNCRNIGHSSKVILY